MAGLNYVFTLNNYTEDELQYARTLVDTNSDIRFICFGEEVGASGTPHLQGFMGFKSPQRLSRCKKVFPRAHFERMRGLLKHNKDYCSKEGVLESFGDIPKEDAAIAAKERWTVAMEAAKRGDFDAIPADMYTRYYRFYEKLAAENVVVPESVDGPLHERFYWIWGPTGVGKSRKAKEMAEAIGKIYRKNKNKWWDRYNGTGPVIIEEWSPEYSGMTDMMKIWADHNFFEGEVKGGSRMMRPSHIFVTSNYSIEECFAGREIETISRRFSEIHLT